MIQAQLKLNDNYIAINPKEVTHVTDAKEQGCVVHFTSGISAHVKNDFLSIVSGMNR